MASVNKVILIGNVGQDPVFADRGNNFLTATFSVATTKTWRDRSTQERRERTDWHRVEVSGKLAEIVRDIIGQGDQVYVEGELNTDRFPSKTEEGKFDFFTKIRAEQVQKLGKRERTAGGQDDDGGPEGMGGDHGDDGQGGGAGGDAPAASAPVAASPAAASPAPSAPSAASAGPAKAAPRGRTFGKKS